MSKVPENDNLSVAIEQATALLLKFSVPLYQNHNGRPSLYGTGFFVKAGNDNFLISAGHVLDPTKHNGLFFYSAPGTHRHLSGQLLLSKHEKNSGKDMKDIGVLKLSESDAPPYLEVDKFAMDISYLEPRYRPRAGKRYILIGFPATKSVIKNTPNKSVTTAPYAFRNWSIDDAEYSKHGLDPDMHVALPLKLKKTFGADGAHQHFPKPQGMSGSPIVVLYDEEGDDDPNSFPVVAVATDYRRSSNILFGTDIQCVLDAIKNSV